MILYVNGARRGGMRQYLNPPRVKKKNLIPIKNPFIKFQPRPIRGGAGRVPEKTRPVAIPIQGHDKGNFSTILHLLGTTHRLFESIFTASHSPLDPLALHHVTSLSAI